MAAQHPLVGPRPATGLGARPFHKEGRCACLGAQAVALPSPPFWLDFAFVLAAVVVHVHLLVALVVDANDGVLITVLCSVRNALRAHPPAFWQLFVFTPVWSNTVGFCHLRGPPTCLFGSFCVRTCVVGHRVWHILGWYLRSTHLPGGSCALLFGHV